MLDELSDPRKGMPFTNLNQAFATLAFWTFFDLIRGSSEELVSASETKENFRFLQAGITSKSSECGPYFKKHKSDQQPRIL